MSLWTNWIFGSGRGWRCIPTILLLLVMCAASGCMTCLTVEKARGWPATSESGETRPTEKPQKGFYAFIPLAVAGDVATGPLQLVAFCLANPQKEESRDFWDFIDWPALLGAYRH